jgi:hypothetical protein
VKGHTEDVDIGRASASAQLRSHVHPGVTITCDLESITPTSPRQVDLYRLSRKGNIRVDIGDGVG